MPKDDATNFEFAGFHSPNYTPVPDELFDELLGRLSGSELKVLLYVIRRTFGFKKPSDNISLSQMLNGITTEDGRILDQGAGIRDRKTLLDAINKLEAKKILLTRRQSSTARGNEPTIYSLNVLSSPPDGKTPPPLEGKPHQGVGGESLPSPWRGNPTTQETVEQKTDTPFEFRKGIHENFPKNGHAAHRETGDPAAREPGNSEDDAHRTDPVVPEGYRQLREQVDHLRRRQEGTGQRPERKRGSAGGDGPQPIGTLLNDTRAASEPTAAAGADRRRGRPPGTADEREQLRAYLGDFAKELHDGAPLAATITRVLRLFREVGVPRERWGDLLYQARAITQEHSGQITTPAGEGSLRGTKNKMPYYLAVLEDLLGLKPAPAAAPDISPSVAQAPPLGSRRRTGRSR